MQFGIFTVGDLTPDVSTGRAPSENERGSAAQVSPVPSIPVATTDTRI